MELLHHFGGHPDTHPELDNFMDIERKGRWTAAMEEKAYQHGVPTKVFLERCLSPASNIHAATPKSANLTVPLVSSNMFPAWKTNLVKYMKHKTAVAPEVKQ